VQQSGVAYHAVAAKAEASGFGCILVPSVDTAAVSGRNLAKPILMGPGVTAAPPSHGRLRAAAQRAVSDTPAMTPAAG
jgi:hypothetical protein